MGNLQHLCLGQGGLLTHFNQWSTAEVTACHVQDLVLKTLWFLSWCLCLSLRLLILGEARCYVTCSSVERLT